MGVAVEGALWVSVLALVAGQVPDDQGLISATGQEHVWAIQKSQLRPRKLKKRAWHGLEFCALLTSPLR